MSWMRVCLYHILEGAEGINKEYRFVICDYFFLHVSFCQSGGSFQLVICSHATYNANADSSFVYIPYLKTSRTIP